MHIIGIKIGKLRIGAKIKVNIFGCIRTFRIIRIVDTAIVNIIFAETSKLTSIVVIIPQNAILDVRVIKNIRITVYIMIVRKINSYIFIMRKSNIIEKR